MVAGAAALWWISAYAQTDRLRRVGFLSSQTLSDPEAHLNLSTLQRTLEALGWQEGRNIQFEVRMFGGETGLARSHARELVEWGSDVIVTVSTPGVEAARQQTTTIPIVFTMAADPVGTGVVEGLRPQSGSNITGFSTFEPEIGGKWLEVLMQVAPDLSQIAGMFDPDFASYTRLYAGIEQAASSVGARLTPAPIRNEADIRHAVASLVREPNSGLIVLPGAVTTSYHKVIVELAAQHRLPAIYPFKFFATDGGLVSYGIDQPEQLRSAAAYVDRILKGEKPENLPVQRPTKFEFVVNLKTAKTLGLVISLPLLGRADEVIE